MPLALPHGSRDEEERASPKKTETTPQHEMPSIVQELNHSLLCSAFAASFLLIALLCPFDKVSEVNSTLQNSSNLPACTVLADVKPTVTGWQGCLESGNRELLRTNIHYWYLSRRGFEGSSQTYPEDRKSSPPPRFSENNFHWVVGICHFSRVNMFSGIIDPQFSFCLPLQQTNACLLYMLGVGVQERAGTSEASLMVSNDLRQSWLLAASPCAFALSGFAFLGHPMAFGIRISGPSVSAERNHSGTGFYCCCFETEESLKSTSP